MVSPQAEQQPSARRSARGKYEPGQHLTDEHELGQHLTPRWIGCRGDGSRRCASRRRDPSHRRSPRHSVVRLASGGDRLTFLGDAGFRTTSTAPTGIMPSTTTPRRPSACGSASCGNWRRPASRIGGRSRVIPVRPGGGCRRRLSLDTDHVGVLTAYRARVQCRPGNGSGAHGQLPDRASSSSQSLTRVDHVTPSDSWNQRFFRRRRTALAQPAHAEPPQPVVVPVMQKDLP